MPFGFFKKKEKKEEIKEEGIDLTKEEAIAPAFEEKVSMEEVSPLVMTTKVESPFKPAFEEEKKEIPKKPVFYIRVSKYKELIASISELKKLLREIETSIENFDRLKLEEERRWKEIKNINSKIAEIIDFFESTFTQPEE